ncbi:MAG: maleylpyruvate isomerase family mycothiol-dependent enzyme [Acidimicrobiales bacterium]
MLLSPRYGSPPVIVIEPRLPGPHPILQQRRRLEAMLADLTDAEWRHPSRCAGWAVQDVVSHLTSTNGFWALSIQAGLTGAPTQFLGAFDPVATPAQLAEQEQGMPPGEALERLRASTAALAAVVDSLGPADWQVMAEAPPGHLPIALVADHALWDCWVHERDIVLPLGRPAVVESDEVLTCLHYGAALGSAFESCAGVATARTVALEVHDPDACIVVTTDGESVRVAAGPPPGDAVAGDGDAVELLEMLSTRDVGRPAPAVVQMLTAGLATVFDQAVGP